MIDVISLGAGVQSTTMALMSAHGELPPADCAIFADTGGEPAAVYRHLDALATVLPFPVHRVQFSDLLDDIRRSAAGEIGIADRAGGYIAAPFFVRNGDGTMGMLRRECTSNYKIRPIQREMKRLLGRDPDLPLRVSTALARSWVGISTDEAYRLKPSQVRWVRNIHPLIDKGMSRTDCLGWMAEHGYPRPPRSACSFCPYRSNAEWRDLRDNHPEDWELAVDLDRRIRDMPKHGYSGLRLGGQVFVHRTGIPLDEVDLRTPEDAGQLNLWTNECEGICGV